MKILKANLSHINMIAPLFDSYRKFYGKSSDLNASADFLSARISSNESVIFLAIDELQNNPAGFVQLYPLFSSVEMKRLWLLNDLFVEENYRRQSVAQRLLDESKQLAKSTKAKGVVLETHISNTEAQTLYLKTGFEIDKEHLYFYYII
jgi:ribosomal protein S18 acetylase RimI-like enzyme